MNVLTIMPVVPQRRAKMNRTKMQLLQAIR
jgi:hypothetical protein